MAMSIAERTREIGIKRAIGGSRSRIVREFVTEASLIGFLGGVIGLTLGAAVVLIVNEASRSSGTILFELTFGTAASAVVFSTSSGPSRGSCRRCMRRGSTPSPPSATNDSQPIE